MNKHYRFGILALVVSFSAQGLRAQELPAEPLIKLPPPGSAWQVKINNPEVATKPATTNAKGKPEKTSVPVLLVIKYGVSKITQGQITFSDGHRDTYYAVNGSLLVQATGSKRVYALPLQTSEEDPFSVKVSAFPGIAWVSKATYKNSEKKNGVDCQHYAKTENYGGTDLKLEAWIAQENQYPVEARVDDLIYSFEAAKPLAEEIKLPDDFRPAITQASDEQSALDAMRKASRR